ncbi:MAG: hypothetical protein LBI02_11515 [Opitutaceae bacterium]|nr:hypothetical protein [Opitutaceae bacterium]
MRLPVRCVSAPWLFSMETPSVNKEAWNLADHIPVDKTIAQSHRGAGVLAEENTIAAFETGRALGTWPACESRTTRAGVIVTFRVGNGRRAGKSIPENQSTATKARRLAKFRNPRHPEKNTAGNRGQTQP